jgi:hypothetical protein
MSFMFEVYYREPVDLVREERLTNLLDRFGGSLTCRDEPLPSGLSRAICLTFEFDERSAAEAAAAELYRLGEHVEGPCDYG